MPLAGRIASFILPNAPTAPATTTTSPVEYQMLPFFCRIEGGIAAGANMDVLKITEGNIYAFHSFSVRNPRDGECVPMGLLNQNTHTSITVNIANDTLNVAIPAAGIPWPAGASFNGWLVIQY